MAKKPEYVERVRALVGRGQVEIIGGPFFEPILASIPRRDRVGQIRAYTEYLESLFGQRIRGMWVPERVWEQSFTSDLVEAGIEGAEPPYRGSEKIASKGITLVRLNKVRKALKRF